MMTALCTWYDANPWVYWVTGFFCFCALLTSVAASILDQSTAPILRLFRSPLIFVLTVGLAFSAFRWPFIFAGALDNPDESQLIAGSITVGAGGLPWKHVDGSTAGPLAFYALLALRPIGLPIDFVSTRILATAFQIVALLAVYGTARRFTVEWAARTALLAAVPAWAFSNACDMVQFCTEHTPILLLSVGTWVATSCPPARGGLWPSASRLLGGALMGAAVFGKPQALPLQSILLLQLLIYIWRDAAAAGRSHAIRACGALLAGAIIPAIGFVVFITSYGLWEQIRQFFWEGNLHYAGARSYPWSNALEGFFDLAGASPGLTAGTLGVLFFAFFGLATIWTGDRGGRLRLAGGWILLLTAFFSIVTPGRTFAHYIHLLILPLCWIAAVHLDGRRCSQSSAAATKPQWKYPLVFIIMTLAWPLWQRIEQPQPFQGKLASWRAYQTSCISDRIREDMKPSDKMAIWGWAPRLYVETGLPQATRDAVTPTMILPGPLQERYRWRFLFDLRRNKPRWFVDSVAPNAFAFSDHDNYGHQTWPELRELIERDYRLLACLDGVWVYVRRD